jgi:hypothetical protein
LPAFVLDKREKPLLPCCQKRARLFLTPGRTVVRPRHPFTMRVKGRVGVWSVRVKIGDMVRAEVPKCNKPTIRAWRVAVRTRGSFQVGNAGAINAKYGKLLDRADGSGYAWRPALSPPAEAGGLKPGRHR